MSIYFCLDATRAVFPRITICGLSQNRAARFCMDKPKKELDHQ